MITQLSLIGAEDKTTSISSLILSAKVGKNAEQFPEILKLYVPEGSLIADVAWGKGRFWQDVDLGRYRLIATDILGGPQGFVDFRQLPYANGSFDALVFDPPYTHSNTKTIKTSIADCYALNATSPRNMASVLALYEQGIAEARRVLKKDGVLIVKCQDQQTHGRPYWVHVKIMDSPGFICEDLLILIQKGVPARRWPQQYHARKNHSFWVILRKLVKEADNDKNNDRNSHLSPM